MLSVVKLLLGSFRKKSGLWMKGEVLQSCLSIWLTTISNSGVSLLVLGLVSGQGLTQRKERQSKKG